METEVRDVLSIGISNFHSIKHVVPWASNCTPIFGKFTLFGSHFRFHSADFMLFTRAQAYRPGARVLKCKPFFFCSSSSSSDPVLIDFQDALRFPVERIFFQF